MKSFTEIFKVANVYKAFINPYKNQAIFAVLLNLIGALSASVGIPLTVKYIIDNLTIGDFSGAWLWFGIMVLAIIVFRFSFYFSDRLSYDMEAKVVRDLGNYSYDNLLARSYEFYSNEFAGKTIDKFKRFVKSFEYLWEIFLYNVLDGLIQVVGSIIVLYFIDYRLGLIMTVWLGFQYWLSKTLISKQIPLDEINAKNTSTLTANISDFITNAFTTIAFGQQEREKEVFRKSNESWRESQNGSWQFGVNVGMITSSSVSVLRIGSFGLIIYLFIAGNITIGSVALLSSYLANIFRGTRMLTNASSKASSHLTNALEFQEILEKPIEITDRQNAEVLNVKEGMIKFNNTVFNYTGEGEDEINGLNLSIKSGQSIGIVGHSGAGKSTIVKLLLRFVDVTDGSIMIDDVDVRDVTQVSLRKSIGYVPQEPLLFHRTLHENIAYGKPSATVREVIEAAEQAKAHEFIKDLPQGYDTLVGERGVKLSGGQRQRVAIARAILKNAPILILDEATSSLDSKSEQQIQSAINNLIKGKTVIAIAHRLSTIKHLDRIIVLEKGQIVEEGSHQELLDKNGIYADLWQHQQGGFIE